MKFDLPQTNEDQFRTYWTFAKKRQDVFFNRMKGIIPATEDPILSKYKFCNAYRASDRASQALIRVIYDKPYSPEDVVFRILLFKLFNKIETWNYLESRMGGEIILKDFSFDLYDQLLSERMASGEPIFTAAYMSCASAAYGYSKKHQNFLSLLKNMFEENITLSIEKAKTLKELYILLRAYPLLGDFMAYQLATDINYSEVVDFEENTFTCAGPGAKRGIHRCFAIDGKVNYEKVIIEMTETQDHWFEKYGLKFQDLWGRKLKAIDIQNLFCETDKYCRAAFPEQKNARSRIKQNFTASPTKIQYFYPPKWKFPLGSRL